MYMYIVCFVYEINYANFVADFESGLQYFQHFDKIGTLKMSFYFVNGGRETLRNCVDCTLRFQKCPYFPIVSVEHLRKYY